MTERHWKITQKKNIYFACVGYDATNAYECIFVFQAPPKNKQIPTNERRRKPVLCMYCHIFFILLHMFSEQ